MLGYMGGEAAILEVHDPRSKSGHGIFHCFLLKVSIISRLYLDSQPYGEVSLVYAQCVPESPSCLESGSWRRPRDQCPGMVTHFRCC